MNNTIPKISLFNVDDDVTKNLTKAGFNTFPHKLNGKHHFINDYGKSTRTFDFYHDIPSDLHESDVIVIDTKASTPLASLEGSPFKLYFQTVPRHIDLMPADIYLIREQINSSHKKRCIIIFCEQTSTESYKLLDEKTDTYSEFKSATLNIGLYIRPVSKHGSRWKSANDGKVNPLALCISKHSNDLTYGVAFEATNSKDVIFLTNESNEVIAWSRIENNSLYLFLPTLKSKPDFILDLLTNVLPELAFTSEIFPEHGAFKWENDFAYISKEEKDIVNRSIEIDAQYEKDKTLITEELNTTREKKENQLLKNLLKETDDELVYAVQWFLSYIGFENVQNPDKNVKSGEIFEEDLRIDGNETCLLFEVKGIGGTSTDAQCSQISKIVLRNRKANPHQKFHGIYIVNHQRYKAPLQRSIPPFNDKQIEDAEISYRGMTYTYELFQIYHMIEQGILTKQQVKEAFLDIGLLNFKSSLIKLPKPHEYPNHNVYSYDLGEDESILIKDNDYIVICDDESHWHKLKIISMQVDKKNVKSVNKDKVGIQVNALIAKAKEHYLLQL
ncbi:hypothetical protein FFB58_00725 [Enterobacter sp. MF024]|uniref:hypothetical protein n=1 Tax=Enterobacter sp. MF024 TaxID=2555644 RepID=UPI001105A9C5|nr:hypothetical protein [Enterobacter sp. MF024]TLU69581.1 hypothetical protein FFB58_00725 [Enterobacter sp. MF024]